MKKLCSVLIALVMVLAMLPLSAFAAEQYTAVSTEEELLDMLEAIESDIMGYGNETGCWKLTVSRWSAKRRRLPACARNTSASRQTPRRS